MKKTAQKCQKVADIVLVVITVVLAIATAWEILNYVEIERGHAKRESHEYSDTISDDTMLILETAQDQTAAIQRGEFHNSILVLLSATLLSTALDAAYFSLRHQKS